ncbi:6310_t:CDS:1 [Ambispora leptoticha]|uniref:6310_t:CDS:1 n=1 Tax=Ambispora leptoticha TaxID=144679 RepID=A0A9N9E5M1_9GLOM|nr:6310_t:CDS:1 [Ambispora leptoticha]
MSPKETNQTAPIKNNSNSSESGIYSCNNNRANSISSDSDDSDHDFEEEEIIVEQQKFQEFSRDFDPLTPPQFFEYLRELVIPILELQHQIRALAWMADNPDENSIDDLFMQEVQVNSLFRNIFIQNDCSKAFQVLLQRWKLCRDLREEIESISRIYTLHDVNQLAYYGLSLSLLIDSLDNDISDNWRIDAP